MITNKQLIDWVAAPTQHTALQVPRALVASALAAALDFATLVWLVECHGWSPALAAVAGYLLGGVLQYMLCALWVFPASPQSVTVGIVAFLVLSLVGLGITWATIAGLHDLLHVNYAVAKVASLGLAFAWNFLSRKYLLFEPASSPDNSATVEVGTSPGRAVAGAELELQYESLAAR